MYQEVQVQLFLAEYEDGSTRFFTNLAQCADEPFIEGRWILSQDSSVKRQVSNSSQSQDTEGYSAVC